MCVLAKRKKLSYEGTMVSGDVVDVLVSEYKPLLSPGLLVMIEGKKHILLHKGEYKCVVLSMTGEEKKVYYKFIDRFYFLCDTVKDEDIIMFMKKLSLGNLSVIEYKNLDGFLCRDGRLHSYSYLFRQYLKSINML